MEIIHSSSQVKRSRHMEQAAGYLTHESWTSLSSVQSAIVMSLVYFDIFHYPLTAEEIMQNCSAPLSSLAEFKSELTQLLHNNIISQTGAFFHLNDRQYIVSRREDLNRRAAGLFPKAKKYSDIISRFPFVEGVLITGSLAKGCMDADGDIDYFIITTPGRLWFARGLLTAFKKIFLLNSRKYFCVNYYISTDNLAISDENIFTSTEIIFAKPTYGAQVTDRFFDSNKWIREYYPNKAGPDVSLMNAKKNFITKIIFENLFNGWIGDKIDSFFFKLFVGRWKAKFKHQDAEAFDINFRSRQNVSKHHPNGFQLKVLSEYEKKIRKFESDHHMIISALGD